jgi:hypothetical protein
MRQSSTSAAGIDDRVADRVVRSRHVARRSRLSSRALCTNRKPLLHSKTSSWRWRFMPVDFGQGHLVEAFVRQRKSMTGWLDAIDRLLDRPREAVLISDVDARHAGGASSLRSPSR